MQSYLKPGKYLIIKFFFLPVLLSFNFALTDAFQDLNIDFLLEDSTNVPVKKQVKSKKKDAKKSFSNIVKDFQIIEGLFTLYWNEKTNQAYVSILPAQLEKIYLAGLTRQSGDGYYLDGSSMLNEYPFMFKKVGERIQFLNANVKFRADKNSPFPFSNFKAFHCLGL